jgi:hypothetical protein
MVNSGELPINAVSYDRPKMLTGLGQKGEGTGGGAPNSPLVDDAPPAERQDLNLSGTSAKRGKPVRLPSG